MHPHLPLRGRVSGLVMRLTGCWQVLKVTGGLRGWVRKFRRMVPVCSGASVHGEVPGFGQDDAGRRGEGVREGAAGWGGPWVLSPVQKQDRNKQSLACCRQSDG